MSPSEIETGSFSKGSSCLASGSANRRHNSPNRSKNKFSTALVQKRQAAYRSSPAILVSLIGTRDTNGPISKCRFERKNLRRNIQRDQKGPIRVFLSELRSTTRY